MTGYIKIVFICGSLEPGKDGVGDYTRRFSAELIIRGHQVVIVAINDRNLSQEFTGSQQFEDITISVFRIPASVSQNERFKRAAGWIENFDPQWLSLQFVPFAFNKRGLPFGIGKLFQKLGKSRRWHIMIHELWVGMDREANFKFVLWGWVQMRLIQSMLKRIKFLRINTQTDLYLKMIGKIGFQSHYLPLFGNIPVALSLKPGSACSELKETERKLISFVVFGGIHLEAPIGQFAKELRIYGNEKCIDFKLRIIGRCGSDQKRWVQEWEDEGLSVEVFGEQPNEFVSEVLSSSNMGISSTPIALIEKSGSFAAMREHGLNVICISRPWNPRGYSNQILPNGAMEYKQGSGIEILKAILSKSTKSESAEVVQQFVDNLLVYK